MAGARGDLNIRGVDAADAPDIQAIYAHHVLHGTASFETVPPTLEFWNGKIAQIQSHGWPFVVVERDGVILGYAYANPFRDRAAYAHTCENSIYIRADTTGQGIGSALIQALINAAAEAGFTQMIAVVGGGEPASVALHAKFGFRHAGRMEKVGLKFGQLLDTVYMQRELCR